MRQDGLADAPTAVSGVSQDRSRGGRRAGPSFPVLVARDVSSGNLADAPSCTWSLAKV